MTAAPRSKPKGGGAVMAQKRPRVSDGTPWQKFELFPTPPWATRAFVEHVLPLVEGRAPALLTAREPFAGLGHMSEVLREYFADVVASDIFDYGADPSIKIFDFLADDCPACDWVISNPPFEPAAKMLARALSRARRGVAFLLRLPWLESQGRYDSVFATQQRPTLIAPFVERVAMCEGGWDPAGSTATAYAWFVWRLDGEGAVEHRFGPGMFPALLIPPGRKEALTRDSDKKLATRCAPGWVPPSTLKKSGKNQIDLAEMWS